MTEFVDPTLEKIASTPDPLSFSYGEWLRETTTRLADPVISDDVREAIAQADSLDKVRKNRILVVFAVAVTSLGIAKIFDKPLRKLIKRNFGSNN